MVILMERQNSQEWFLAQELKIISTLPFISMVANSASRPLDLPTKTKRLASLDGPLIGISSRTFFVKLNFSYRVHDKDPLFFNDGFKLQWRVGDIDDMTGMKCHTLTGGKTHGKPKTAGLVAYMWYYTWPAS